MFLHFKKFFPFIQVKQSLNTAHLTGYLTNECNHKYLYIGLNLD